MKFKSNKAKDVRTVLFYSLIAFCVALFIAALIYFLRVELQGSLVALCDALFSSAVILLSAASIIFVWRKGGFDAFVYIIRCVVGALTMNGKRVEYPRLSHEGRRGGLSSAVLSIVGALFMIPAVVLSILSAILN